MTAATRIWPFQCGTRIPYRADATVLNAPTPLPALCSQTPAALPPPTAIHGFLLIERAHTSGYRIHPAVGDALLHLAAAIATPGAQPVLRVPAGVELIMFRGLTPGVAFPLVSQGETHRDTSVSCGFKLARADGGAGFEVGNLLAKELHQAEPAAKPEEVCSLPADSSECPHK